MSRNAYARWLSLFYVLVVALLLSACVHRGQPGPQGPGQSRSAAAHTRNANSEDPVLALLDYARELAQATPAERVQAVALARKQAATKPNGMRYARLALAFGTPGQKRYTPDEAARYARRALADEQTAWSPAAQQYLADLIRLYDRSNQRVSTPQPADAAPSDGESERVRALESELAEAHRKLRELADIEARLEEQAR